MLRSGAMAELANGVALGRGETEKLEPVHHPISVTQAGIHLHVFVRIWAGESDRHALFGILQLVSDDRSESALAETGHVPVYQNGLFGLSHFDQNKRQIDLDAWKSAHAVEFPNFFLRGL